MPPVYAHFAKSRSIGHMQQVIRKLLITTVIGVAQAIIEVIGSTACQVTFYLITAKQVYFQPCLQRSLPITQLIGFAIVQMAAFMIIRPQRDGKIHRKVPTSQRKVHPGATIEDTAVSASQVKGTESHSDKLIVIFTEETVMPVQPLLYLGTPNRIQVSINIYITSAIIPARKMIFFILHTLMVKHVFIQTGIKPPGFCPERTKRDCLFQCFRAA